MIGFVKGLMASMFVPPVGYLWKSASAVSPASIYEGTTWAQIKDRAILAAGSSYENGTTGGSEPCTRLQYFLGIIAYAQPIHRGDCLCI